MPQLKNNRHEIFAQGLAMGKSQTKAYIDAGFSADGAQPNSARLILNDMVLTRVKELQAENSKICALTLDGAIIELEKARKMAMALGQCSAAIGATMSKAKLLGLEHRPQNLTNIAGNETLKGKTKSAIG